MKYAIGYFLSVGSQQRYSTLLLVVLKILTLIVLFIKAISFD